MLFDKYLAFNEELAFFMSSTVDNHCHFELHPLPSSSKEESEVSSSSQEKWIYKKSLVRLYHCVSKKYVMINENIYRKDRLVFSLDNSDIEKDVFRMVLTTTEDVAVLISAKKCKAALEMLLPEETDAVLSKMTILLDDFRRHIFGSSKNSSSTSDNTHSRFRYCQNVLNDLEFSKLLLEINALVFERYFGIEDPVNNLAASQVMRSAYKLLDVILTENFDSVESILRITGSVRQMFLHNKAGPHNSMLSWSPPIMKLVDSSKLAPLDQLSTVELVTSDEIRMLLDTVYDSIVHGKVPSPFPYQFLSKVCSTIDYQQIGQSSAGYINQALQLSVCQQILGCATLCSSSDSSPFWSAMVYRTFIHEESTPDGLKSKRLVISTCPYGQSRPSLISGK